MWKQSSSFVHQIYEHCKGGAYDYNVNYLRKLNHKFLNEIRITQTSYLKALNTIHKGDNPAQHNVAAIAVYPRFSIHISNVCMIVVQVDLMITMSITLEKGTMNVLMRYEWHKQVI